MKFILLSILLALQFSTNAQANLDSTLDLTLPDPIVTVNFAQIKKDIMVPHCIKCHRNYSEYSSVSASIDHIISAVESGRMPKDTGKIDVKLINLLKAWKFIGTPDTSSSGDDDGDDNDDSLKATYSSINEKIIQAKCVFCHNPSGQANWIDFSSRLALMRQAKYLFDFDASENSYLLDVLRDTESPMPPGANGANRLSDEEIAVIQEWIGLGLP